MVCWVTVSNGGTPKIPAGFTSLIARVTTPIEYKEVLPFHGGERMPVPATVTRSQALEDTNMFEYLLKTSYAGLEYWENRGVDSGSFFSNLRDAIRRRNTLRTQDFEGELSSILKRIHDGHIALIGLGYNHAYRHKAVYYCDILVEESDGGVLRVKDSETDGVRSGDLFTERDREKYLFPTLSPTNKRHYLIGLLSFDVVRSKKLSFNDEAVEIPFHKSRLMYARPSDPQPFYIDRVSSVPIVRVTSFADNLYPDMERFMDSGNNLRNERIIVVNLLYNGGGSSVFPQTFIRNLNGTAQWEIHWARLTSPAITAYFARYDLNARQNISPSYRNLIVTNAKEHKQYRLTPRRSWDFGSSPSHKHVGTYDGTMVFLVNRRVLSAGEGMIGASRSVKNRILIGENTGGVAQFSDTLEYYLPNSHFIAKIPRQLLMIPDLEECVGYLPDYWLDTTDPVAEVLNWLDDRDSYQFRYSDSYVGMLEENHLAPALPDDVEIEAPRHDLPEAIQAFSGKWLGVVDGILDHMLVVERIEDNLGVTAIHSWGVAYQWDINQPGWQRYRGRFENQKLVLASEDNRIIITYERTSDSSLLETYRRPGVLSHTTLSRVTE